MSTLDEYSRVTGTALRQRSLECGPSAASCNNLSWSGAPHGEKDCFSGGQQTLPAGLPRHAHASQQLWTAFCAQSMSFTYGTRWQTLPEGCRAGSHRYPRVCAEASGAGTSSHLCALILRSPVRHKCSATGLPGQHVAKCYGHGSHSAASETFTKYWRLAPDHDCSSR
jgi:hypothetical protein